MTTSQSQFRPSDSCVPESDRQLLFAANDTNDELLDSISAAGWNIRLAHDIHEVREECASGHINVGVMQFDRRVSNLVAVQDVIQTAGRQVKWIALVSRASIQDPEVRSLIARGFYDFHTLPADVDRLSVTLGRAFGMAVFESDILTLANRDTQHIGIIGQSDSMSWLRRTIDKAAAVDAPVLVRGESGTGKELVAMSIHAGSRRRAGPFVPVNCASIPGPLIQSELFGYEKGAFTGALKRTIGKIEAARGGTIFLDEIGDLSPDLQANLLRFLQEGTIQRVGGTAEIGVDLRVIAATHVDLLQAVRESRFREDLYYRLKVLEITVPPLRDRAGDVEALAQHFFSHYCNEKQPHLKGFSSRAIQAMCAYDWPGNVRELINRVRHAMIMSDNVLISASDLGLSEIPDSPSLVTLEEARSDAERKVIRETLPRAHNNLSEAARMLGISRGTLYRLLEKHKLMRALGEIAQ